ncbi:MAG: hypothetical protein JJE44_04575 [Flavobacteriaceae bacterium]|nr:hypothetical protein [Flavobacteriaceae bacterium]
MTTTYKNITLFIFLFVFGNLSAQENHSNHKINLKIPEVALINVYSNSAISLGNNTVVEAGQPLNIEETNNSVWINYSSIVGSQTQPGRDITLRISEGTIPDGVKLYVKVAEDMGAGAGTMGKPVSEIQELTANPLTIITDIGSSYTGVGANKGNNVQYTLKLSDEPNAFANLDFNQSSTLVINYTLSDN